MFLTRLSQADGISCRWIFKRPAYPVDFAGDVANQADYAEGDYADEGFGYASQEGLTVALLYVYCIKTEPM